MMSAQIKKSVSGPMTADADAAAGVAILFPDNAKASLMLSDLDEATITRLAVHGLSQKLGDSYAGAAKDENPLGFAKRRVSEVIEQLKAGEWRVTTESGPQVTLLAKALARATGQTVEAAVQVLSDQQAKLDNEETKKADNPWKQWRAELQAQPAIKKAMADIKLEEAQAAAQKEVGEQETDLGSLFK